MKKILIILSAVVLICVSSVIILCSRYPKTGKFENFDDLSFDGAEFSAPCPVYL